MDTRSSKVLATKKIVSGDKAAAALAEKGARSSVKDAGGPEEDPNQMIIEFEKDASIFLCPFPSPTIYKSCRFGQRFITRVKDIGSWPAAERRLSLNLNTSLISLYKFHAHDTT